MFKAIPALITVTKEGTKLPSYYNDLCTGADIFAPEDVLLKKGSRVIINTGICISAPSGFDIQIRSRSGLAAKHGIMVLNSPGTIDTDYKDELMVILANFGDEDYQIKKGYRIAQMVLVPFYRMHFIKKPFQDKPKPPSKPKPKAFNPNQKPKPKVRTGGLGSTGK